MSRSTTATRSSNNNGTTRGGTTGRTGGTTGRTTDFSQREGAAITSEDATKIPNFLQPQVGNSGANPLSSDQINTFINSLWHSDTVIKTDDPILKLFGYLSYLSGGNPDALSSATNTLLQYMIGEQNYQRNFDYSELNYARSLAPNQVGLMMSAGMSRAAALAALQGGSAPQSVSSDTAVQPNPTTIEESRISSQRAIFDTLFGAAKLGSNILSLASIPFDLSAKKLTNKLLENQGNLLSMQTQGLQDAAMFTQAVANYDKGVTDPKKLLGSKSINDQFAYFANMVGQSIDPAKHRVSAWQYAQSDSFKRAASNPFFWSALHDTVSGRNSADASQYDPARAEQEVSALRAGIEYTKNLAFNEKITARILSSQAFIDEYSRVARADMEKAKAIAQQKGFEFDEQRSRAFLDRVDTFNALDFANLNYQLKRVLSISDPKVFKQEMDAYTSSLDYQVANYIYGTSIASLKSGALQSLMETDDTGKSMPTEDLMNWTRTYLQYNELGYDRKTSSMTDIARTVFSGVTAASALSFVGFKIVKGLEALKPAATAIGQGSSVALPFNSLAPLVIPAPELLKQTMPFGFGGSAAQPEIY